MEKSAPTLQPISLSALVKNVASELRALKQSPPKPGEEVMTLTNCDIELSVGATLEGNAGLKFYVIEIGGKGSATASHKITLKFAASGSAILAVASQVRPAEGGPVSRPNPAKKN